MALLDPAKFKALQEKTFLADRKRNERLAASMNAARLSHEAKVAAGLVTTVWPYTVVYDVRTAGKVQHRILRFICNNDLTNFLHYVRPNFACLLLQPAADAERSQPGAGHSQETIDQDEERVPVRA